MFMLSFPIGSEFCLFVLIIYILVNNFKSHVVTIFYLPGLNQYLAEDKVSS